MFVDEVKELIARVLHVFESIVRSTASNYAEQEM